MEDVLAIISLFVILPTIIFSFTYRMRKLKAEERIAMAEAKQLSVGGGEELRLSELQALIEDAVDEATVSLHDRIEALERGEVGPLDPLTGEYAGGYQAPNAPQRTVGRVRG